MAKRLQGESSAWSARFLGCALVLLGVVLLLTPWRFGAVLPGGLGVWLLTHVLVTGGREPVRAPSMAGRCESCHHVWEDHEQDEAGWECWECVGLAGRPGYVVCHQPRP